MRLDGRTALLVALVLAASGRPARSQIQADPRSGETVPQPSHVPLPSGSVTPENADDYLRQRLFQAEMMGNFHELALEVMRNPSKFNLSPEDLKRLQTGQPNLARPELRQAIQKMLEQQAQQTQDPAMAEKWKEALQRLQHSAGNNGPASSAGTGPPGTRPPSMPGPERQQGSTINGAESSGQMPFLPPPVPPALAPPQPPSRLNEGLWGLARQMQETPLGRSEALRRMVGSLDRLQSNPRSGLVDWSGLGHDLAQRWPGWQKSWPQGVSLPRIDWRALSRLGSSPGGGPAGTPVDWGLSAPAPGEDLGAAAFLGLLAVFGLAGWLVWNRILKGRLGSGSLGSSLARARPMIAPDSVLGPEDFIRAFETLALTRLGDTAVTSNHLQIAAGLAEQGPAGPRQEAARRLAGLYEWARYAPREDHLAPGQMARARQDLRLFGEAAGP